jgi:hypothetical protein
MFWGQQLQEQPRWWSLYRKFCHSVPLFRTVLTKKKSIISLKRNPFSFKLRAKIYIRVHYFIWQASRVTHHSDDFTWRQGALLQFFVCRGTGNLAKCTAIMFLPHFQNRGTVSFDSRIRTTQQRRCSLYAEFYERNEPTEKRPTL